MSRVRHSRQEPSADASATRTPILLGESSAGVVRVVPHDGLSWIEKSGPFDEMRDEVTALLWCAGHLPVAYVLEQRGGFLKMSELPGRPLSTSSADTACVVVVDALRQIHAIPMAACPLLADWDTRLQQGAVRVWTGLVDASDFDEENLGRSPESILEELRSLPPLPDLRCFTHGDAALENFLAHDGELSGIVDMGRAGMAHPAQDWALALRSMRAHFGNEGERQLREHLPPACAEPSLLHRFCLLDELF